MLNIDEINKAGHIVIALSESSNKATVAAANALYSYILTLHKKVSLYSPKNTFDRSLDFLPWVDKLKSSYPSSSDLEVKLEDPKEVFELFKTHGIKLNKKMATSLYASLIAQNDGFSKDVQSMMFALAEELVAAGADVESCTKYILNYNSLASIRLKAILLGKMVLVDNAQTAMFKVEDKDLKSSGAALKECRIIVKDALSLPSVKRVIVKYKNKEIIREGDKV